MTLVRARKVPGGDFARSGPHWSRVVQDALLARAVSRIPAVDIVHGHNVEGPLVARLARVSCPIVYGQHTAMAEELPQWFPLPGVRQIGRIVDAVLPAVSDASIALSYSGVQTLSGMTAMSPPGVHLADLAGADPERSRRRYGLDPRPWVIYAGNTDPYQDLDRLFEAMTQVPSAGLLVVTGNDAEPWLALGRRLGISEDRLRVVGGATFSDMKDALAASTVAVCPRRLCRGFPIKLLNQLGLGVPTVCAPGSARPIDGVVAAVDDTVDGLACAIRELVVDPGRRERLSRLAIEDVARRWSWDARAHDVIRVYQRVLRRGR
ncbi:MAG: D-inositol-3-phosphate glycosyltransferase [Myxococcota bacterium]